MFIELRREFDEVASSRSAGKTGILGVREHAVQGVPKLVEHGNDIGEGDEGRFAFSRFRQVGDVEHDGRGPAQARLADEF